MKVVVVGPVSPYRSGIARHTTALASALAARTGVELSVVSFARQYPALLYPGSDERDPQGQAPAGIDVAFQLDALNPFNWHRVARDIILKRPDLVILPAWTFFVAPALGSVARLLRRAGVPVAMIVHNAEDHEQAAWKTALTRFQLAQASRFVTHNASILADLSRLAPGTPARTFPHPLYDTYPKPKGTLPRERGLELLFFGIVRPYKGLDIALRALKLAGLRDVRLAVVGEFWNGRADTDRLIADLDLADHVELVPRYVPDEEAAEYFARCDAVVAPYRTATGSGVVALAQWYERPVIASDVPGLAASVDDGVTGWLFTAGSAEALAETIARRASRDAAAAMHPGIAELRARCTWHGLADALLAP